MPKDKRRRPLTGANSPISELCQMTREVAGSRGATGRTINSSHNSSFTILYSVLGLLAT